MYIGSGRRRGRRRSSPVRVIILLILIFAALYIYALVRQERVVNPFVPTPVPPTPTRSALSFADEGEALYWEGKLSQAIAAYERAIALDPDDVLYHVPLARLLVLDGQIVEALRVARHAVDMAPESAQAWAVLGMAYDWNGDVPEAIDACKRAIDLDPTYANAYAYLAEAYADAIRWAEAIEVAQTALQLDDRSVDAHRNYGYVLEKQADYRGAVQQYEQALQIHPNLAYLHLAAGRNYQVLGNFPAAEESFQRVIQIDPDNVEAYYRLGRAYYEMEEYERAETYLSQATEVDPEFAPAFGYLAFTYWRRRNYESAIEKLEPAIELACREARRQVTGFSITVEPSNDELSEPSPGAVMRGEFVVASETDQDMKRAQLVPTDEDDQAWDNAQGEVTFNARSGQYTVVLADVPQLEFGQVYVGWFEGVNGLSGDPLNTGPLVVQPDGSLQAELETGWVDGPRIEYFYTLGLAYFYMAECEKSYPLFDAALAIDPEDINAIEGIRLCREAELEDSG